MKMNKLSPRLLAKKGAKKKVAKELARTDHKKAFEQLLDDAVISVGKKKGD